MSTEPPLEAAASGVDETEEEVLATTQLQVRALGLTGALLRERRDSRGRTATDTLFTGWHLQANALWKSSNAPSSY